MDKKTLLILSSLLIFCTELNADDQLARQHNCFACHSIRSKLVGPAFIDIAAKYQSKDLSEDEELEEIKLELMDKIQRGSVGVWGDIPMSPNANVPDADLDTLVGWILSY